MNRTGDDGGGWTAISIRRDGNRPLRFVGRLIDAFDDQRSALPASFRLLLYKIQFGGYVILIDARIGHSDGDVIEKRDQIFLASKIEEIPFELLPPKYEFILFISIGSTTHK